MSFLVFLAIKKFQNKFIVLLKDKFLEFYSCQELKEEIQTTFTKERLQKYLDKDLIEKFWSMFDFSVHEIKITSVVEICRDKKDNFLLALAKDAHADFLLTGDKDLLDIGKFENTIICTLTTFIEKFYPGISGSKSEL